MPSDCDSPFNGLMWGDYHAGPTPNIYNEQRGNTYSYNITYAQGLLRIINSVPDANYSIDFIARGHQHSPGGVLRLTLQDPQFTPLVRQENVSPQSIYMFMCLNINYFSTFRYSVWSSNGYRIWHIQLFRGSMDTDTLYNASRRNKWHTRWTLMHKHRIYR